MSIVLDVDAVKLIVLEVANPVVTANVPPPKVIFPEPMLLSALMLIAPALMVVPPE